MRNKIILVFLAILTTCEIYSQDTREQLYSVVKYIQTPRFKKEVRRCIGLGKYTLIDTVSSHIGMSGSIVNQVKETDTILDKSIEAYMQLDEKIKDSIKINQTKIILEERIKNLFSPHGKIRVYLSCLHNNIIMIEFRKARRRKGYEWESSRLLVGLFYFKQNGEIGCLLSCLIE